MTKSDLRPFQVVRTAKVKDNRGEYVHRGDIAMLNKETAQHYHRLGYIRVQMEDLFKDDPDADDRDGPDSGADEAETLSGPDDAQPTGPVGGADEGEASSDASPNVGTGAPETGSRLASKRRRKRATS